MRTRPRLFPYNLQGSAFDVRRSPPSHFRVERSSPPFDNLQVRIPHRASLQPTAFTPFVLTHLVAVRP